MAVAVGEPAATFEGDGRGGEDTLERAAAVGADGDLGVGELLDFFCVLVAGGAFVFVKRHVLFFLDLFSVHLQFIARSQTLIQPNSPQKNAVRAACSGGGHDKQGYRHPVADRK